MATEATTASVKLLEREGDCLAALVMAATDHGFEFVNYRMAGGSNKRGLVVEFTRTSTPEERSALASPGQQHLALEAGEEQNGPATLSDDGSEEAEKPAWYQR